MEQERAEREKEKKINPSVIKEETMTQEQRSVSFKDTLFSLLKGKEEVPKSDKKDRGNEEPVFEDPESAEEIEDYEDEFEEEKPSKKIDLGKKMEEEPIFYSSDDEPPKPAVKAPVSSFRNSVREVVSSDSEDEVEIEIMNSKKYGPKMKQLAQMSQNGYYLAFENLELLYPETFKGLNERIRGNWGINTMYEPAFYEMMDELGIEESDIKSWHIVLLCTCYSVGMCAKDNLTNKNDKIKEK